MVNRITSKYNLLKHEWILLIILLAFMALSAGAADYINKTQQVTPTFFEVISEQVNDPQMILYPLMYVLILFTAYGKTIDINKKTPGVLLKDSLCITAVYMLLFIAANLLYCLLSTNIDGVFKNTWSYQGDLYYSHLSPLAAASASIMLMFMRFCFLVFLIYFINTVTKKSFWGFWSAFFITYIDYMFYEILLISYPWGILPIEHTRIVYTPAIVPDFDHTGIRSPFYVSILYWVGLIVVLYISLLLINKRRGRHEEANS